MTFGQPTRLVIPVAPCGSAFAAAALIAQIQAFDRWLLSPTSAIRRRLKKSHWANEIESTGSRLLHPICAALRCAPWSPRRA